MNIRVHIVCHKHESELWAGKVQTLDDLNDSNEELMFRWVKMKERGLVQATEKKKEEIILIREH